MSSDSVRVLLVEDNPGDARLLAVLLQEAGGNEFVLTHVERLADAVQALKADRFDALLLDLSLPDSSGMDTVRTARAAAGLIPIVVMTGLDDEQKALEALRCGAQDYLVKGQHDGKLLVRALRYARERARIETALRESEERFRRFFENDPEYCYMVAPEGTILDVNRSALSALGYSREELVGRPISHVYATESRARAEELMARWRETGLLANESVTVVTKGGVCLDVLLSMYAVRDDTGTVVHSVSVQRDITELRRAEELLKHSEERYRSTLDGMMEGCQLISSDWTYVYVNPAAAAQARMPRDQMEGRRMSEVYPGIEQTPLYAALKECLEQRVHRRLDYEWTYPDGNSAWFELSIQPVADGLFVLSLDITERKRFEAALRESEERYRDLFDNASDMIQSVGPDGRFLYTNNAWRKALGYTDEDLAKMTLFDVMAPSCRETCIDRFKEVMSGRQMEGVEATFIAKDGTEVAVEGSVNCSFRDGRPVVTRGFFRNVTERKRAEEAMRVVQERREQLEAVVGRSPAVAFKWRTDDALTVDFVSDNVRQFGYSPEDFTSGRVHYVDILHPHDRARALDEARQYVAAGVAEFVQEYRIITEAGDVRWVEDRTWVPREPDGAVRYHQGIVIDVTSRKQAEQELKESERRFREIMENVELAGVTLDLTGNVTFVNDFLLRLTGWSREEVIGQNWFDRFIAEADRPARRLRFLGRVQGDGTPYRHENEVVTRTGEVRTISWSSTFLRDNRGRISGVTSIGEDVTEERRTRAELAAKNAELLQLNEFKNQMLGMAAHDLRNPLAVIHTASSFLATDSSKTLSEEKRTDFMHRIHANSEFMVKLIDDLLDVARIESGKLELELEPTELCRLIDDSLSINRVLAEQKNIKLEFAAECVVPPLPLDRNKMAQVINNLVTNALKFSQSGTSVRVSAARENGRVVVAVADQGQGIPADELSKLFRPFGKTSVRSTAGEKSTGLGLAISRRIVEAHGGNIWAESEVGRGSVFRFSLPVGSG